jgi:hypothetical protein
MAVVKQTKASCEVIKLSDEQSREIVEEINAILPKRETIVALYKIELMFVGRRSLCKPTRGALSAWESGAKLHGGGDVAVYFCPGKMTGKNNCEMPIRSVHNAGGRMVCSHCDSVWHDTQPYNTMYANLPMTKWADVLIKYYQLLGHNADIYLKHSGDDIRAILQKDKDTKANGELMHMSECDVALHIYPLANIIKDTAAGADLHSRFHAFLVS